MLSCSFFAKPRTKNARPAMPKNALRDYGKWRDHSQSTSKASKR
jgi:hypothetical protein